ncbi:MAG: ABC transporter ATP-binding protein [Lachnospiraceae bacterium]|nr:ABC transporter ATP-binding protein [Lachnospiraceae bacterium]
MSLLEVKNIKKVYTSRFGAVKVQALSDVNFFVEEGEYVAVMGESGSGKTTLLNILASLDKATSGQVLLNGRNMAQIKHRDICAFRREHLGFVFQDFNLLDTLSVRDNIYLPLVLAGKDWRHMEERLLPLAEKLEIADILEKFPYEVSGGQKQRVAACRALITEPDIVLADEPTGALDSRAAGKLLKLFGEVNREGQTILMVTHSIQAASHAGRVLFIKDGCVFHQVYRGSQSKEEMYKVISDTLTVLQTRPQDIEGELRKEEAGV